MKLEQVSERVAAIRKGLEGSEVAEAAEWFQAYDALVFEFMAWASKALDAKLSVRQLATIADCILSIKPFMDQWGLE